jgi:hypothetical protein
VESVKVSSCASTHLVLWVSCQVLL